MLSGPPVCKIFATLQFYILFLFCVCECSPSTLETEEGVFNYDGTGYSAFRRPRSWVDGSFILVFYMKTHAEEAIVFFMASPDQVMSFKILLNFLQILYETSPYVTRPHASSGWLVTLKTFGPSTKINRVTLFTVHKDRHGSFALLFLGLCVIYAFYCFVLFIVLTTFLLY